VPGTLTDIDVNLASVNREELKAIWPQGRLLPPEDPDPPLILAKIELPGVFDRSIAADTIITAAIPGDGGR
jgi:hypothetical protein